MLAETGISPALAGAPGGAETYRAAFFLLLTVAMALPNLFFSHRAGS